MNSNDLWLMSDPIYDFIGGIDFYDCAQFQLKYRYHNFLYVTIMSQLQENAGYIPVALEQEISIAIKVHPVQKRLPIDSGKNHPIFTPIVAQHVPGCLSRFF